MSGLIRYLQEVFPQVLQLKSIEEKADMCAYQEVKHVRFSENLTCFVLLKHPY